MRTRALSILPPSQSKVRNCCVFVLAETLVRPAEADCALQKFSLVRYLLLSADTVAARIFEALLRQKPQQFPTESCGKLAIGGMRIFLQVGGWRGTEALQCARSEGEDARLPAGRQGGGPRQDPPISRAGTRASYTTGSY